MAAATDNMGVAKRFMNQKAIYWAPSELDRHGKPTWANPIEIDCRWDDMAEEIIGPNGEQILSRAQLIVDRDLELKGKLKLGDLDSTIEDDPNDNKDAWEIIQVPKTPDRKGTKFLREAYL